MRYLLFLFVLISSTTLAQNGINYQGAATDSDGAKLVDQNISLRTSVLQGGVEGTISYSETHNTTTDQFGLFNVVIGQGEVVSGDFEGISWGADAHFLKVELDATGGSDYSLVSTTQMMSVPYALYAENANINYDSISNLLSENIGFIDCGFGDFETVNIIFPDGPNYSYFKEALTDQIILGQLANGLQYQAMVEVWTDTTLTEDQGKIFSIGSSNGVYTIPIKKGQFYRLPPWTSFQFLGSIPINCGGGSSSSSSSLDSAMVADMIAEKIGINNINPAYPLPLNSEILIHKFTTNYIVPEGKNLSVHWLSHNDNSTDYLYVNGKRILSNINSSGINAYANYYGDMSLRLPFILEEGDTLSTWHTNQGFQSQTIINGYLSDKKVESIIHTLANDNVEWNGSEWNGLFEYTVPENKILVIQAFSGEQYGTSDLMINGNEFLNINDNFMMSSIPIILKENDVISLSNPTNSIVPSNFHFIGYLANENYFVDTSNEGETNASDENSIVNESSGLDSAMVAEMIQSALSNSISIGVGDYYGGGIVAYIFQAGDEGYIDGEVHGYIVYNNDLYAPWGCEQIVTNANSDMNGLFNTQQIINSCDEDFTAAKYCNDLVIGPYDDWFLPSPHQLSICSTVFGDYNLIPAGVWTSCEWYDGADPSGGFSPGLGDSGNPFHYARVFNTYYDNFYWQKKSNVYPFVAFREF